jgi:predicted DNA-binding transcriptional regulator AlpA
MALNFTSQHRAMNAPDHTTFLMRERERLKAKAANEAAMFISIYEIAEKYKISLRTLRRLQATGKMPPRTRLGKKKMYWRDAIEALFQQHPARKLP